MVSNSSFPYPLLPSGVDAVRILTIAPGDFPAPLVGSLTAVAFSEKPKYIALSYTWGTSYADNSTLPTSQEEAGFASRSPGTSPNRIRSQRNTPSPDGIRPHESERLMPHDTPRHIAVPSQTTKSAAVSLTLNNHTFYAGRNLQLALLHLRSPKCPIDLWVDAVCINQQDGEERNRQVALMTFIYTKAIKVAAWLGMRDYSNTTNAFRSMSIHWKAGQTQHLAAVISSKSKMRYSSEPDHGTFVRIAESAFWKRLWIVQEVCLPSTLVFAYGSQIWLYEDFRRWNLLPDAGLKSIQARHEDYDAMLRLLETRDKRHSMMMRLESLIERFQGNECSEVRDMVYGLIGCANDVQPVVGQDARSESLNEHVKLLSVGQIPSSEPQRGMGSLEIDYTRPYFDIWASVIYFVYFQAQSTEQTTIRVEHMGWSARRQRGNDHCHDERRVNIVRTAGVVQRAFRQQIETELKTLTIDLHNFEHPVIKAVGYIAGELVQIGPPYNSLIASFRAYQDWTRCWADHYKESKNLEMLRRINEEFSTKILEYDTNALRRIRLLYNPYVAAWPVTQEECDIEASNLERTQVEMEDMDNEYGPNICLGTGCMIGLIPQGARLGDVIVKFWNCDAAVVMRRMPSSEAHVFKLVGRADVAEVTDRRATPGADARAEQVLSGHSVSGFEMPSPYPQVVFIDLDMRTLQRITASIST